MITLDYVVILAITFCIGVIFGISSYAYIQRKTEQEAKEKFIDDLLKEYEKKLKEEGKCKIK